MIVSPKVAPRSYVPFGPDEVPLALAMSDRGLWEPGDVLLFHNPRFNLMTWAIHVSTKSRWNHAALYLGNGKYVEATASGVKVSSFEDRGHDQIIATRIVGMYDDEDDKNDVLAWAAGRVGTRYGYFNAFFCGLRHIFPGALQLKMGDSVICSELVAESLERAGMDFLKDSALVSPGDVAEVMGVGR